MRALALAAVLVLCASQATAFLGAVPTRHATPGAATAKTSLFKRNSVILKPTLIINHSGNELPQPEQEALILEASKILARELGKPESYVLASINKSTMSFGGKVGPTAFLYVASIGRVGPETNPGAAKSLTDLVSAKLGVPPNRCFVQFVDSAGSNFAWQGNTFG